MKRKLMPLFEGETDLKPAKTFGQTLRRQRRLMEISQGALAELSGVSETHIKRLEKDIPDPGMNVIFRLSNALELTPGELLTNAYADWREKTLEDPDNPTVRSSITK